MANFFDRTYPNTGRALFDGGLNTKFEKSLIPDNESPDCANVTFQNGSVGTRGGSTSIASSIGSHIGDGLYTRHDHNGSETMVCWGGGNMYDLQNATFVTIPSAQSVFVSGSRIGAAEYENYLFIGQSGVTTPYKWNGSFTRHGVYPPTTGPTFTTNGAGTLTGSYSWKVTFVNSNLVEGNPSSASVTTTAAANQYTITVPTAPQSFGVNSRRVYRTEAGGSTYKRVGTVNDNVTTTFADNVSDGSLGLTAPSDNGVPPQYTFIKSHQNRLFCNDVTNLNFGYYSELASPYVFGALSFVRIGDNSGELLRNIEVFDNGVVWYTDLGAWITYMPDTTPANWVTVRAKMNLGTRSPFGSVFFQNKIMFPAIDNGKLVGFAALQGDVLAPSATFLTVSVAGSELQSDVIEPDVFDIQEDFMGNISAQSFKNRLYFTVTKGAAQLTNNRVYVYDFSISNLAKKKQGAWVPYTGISAAQFTIYDGKLHYIESTATGLVKQLETASYNDDGAAIDSYFWTKEFSGLGGDEDMQKDFRTMQLLFDKAGAYFMNLMFRVDSDLGSGNILPQNLDPGGSLWGRLVWGRDLWGGGSGQEDKRIFLGQTRGKRIQFGFSNQNTLNQRFKAHSMRFSYNIKGKR